MTKRICIQFAAMLAVALVSCSKETPGQLPSEEKNTQVKITVEEEQEQAFARTLSSSISENKELRSLLKKQALKQFDNNNDVLYHQIKDTRLSNGKTVRDVLLSHWTEGEEKFREIEANLPLLNIFLPDMSLFELGSDISWDTEAPEVGVAVREHGKGQVGLFVAGNLVSHIEDGEIPAIPTLVVNINKRVKVASSARTFNGDVKFSYQFRDPVFDGSKRQQARNAYVWEAPETDLVDASSFNWQTREVIESVRRGNPAGQRASIYYPHEADLDRTVNEQLLRFRISKEAYGLISDDIDDPRLTGGYKETFRQVDASIDEVISYCWTQGNYTFVFEVHSPMQSGGSEVTRMVFNVTPKQLFIMNPDRERRHPTWFRKTRYRYRVYQSALSPRWVYPAQLNTVTATRLQGPWDLSEYALSKKIFVSEFDESGTVTKTQTMSSEFLVGASAEASVKIPIIKEEVLSLKAGGKVEKKSSKSVTHTVTTQKKSDDLGSLSLFFYDPIIVSADGGKYELFNISNGTVTATFVPVKTSRY